jgi:DNA sulfur modification protein DndC
MKIDCLIIIKKLINDGAVFICNHSGGKDSQLMYAYLKSIVPPSQLFVIHAHLVDVEWPGTIDHIKNNIDNLDQFYIVQARRSLFQMIDERGMFPSPKNRQCTSDLKRGPIDKQIRWICNQFGFTTVVNCMGLRADESSGRSKKSPLKIRESLSTLKRTVFDWLPIHDVTTNEVYSWIEMLGQKLHWAYRAGMTRLSCCFCIMMSEPDLYTASKLMPELFHTYLAKERSTGNTMMMPSKSKGRRTLDMIVSDYEQKLKLKTPLL